MSIGNETFFIDVFNLKNKHIQINRGKLIYENINPAPSIVLASAHVWKGKVTRCMFDMCNSLNIQYRHGSSD